MDTVTTTFDQACYALAAKADCGRARLRRAVRGELAGADMVEYVVLAALIVIALITVIQALASALGVKFNLITTTLKNTTAGTVSPS